MKRIKLLGLALLAVFAMGAIAAQGAMAETEPTILPSTFPIEFTSESKGSASLVGAGGTVTCPSATNKGSFTSANGGTISIDFKGCKKESTACTGAGEATEVILTSGNFQLVDVLPSGTLELGIKVEPKEGTENKVTFKCGFITVVVLGSVIGLAENEKEGKLGSLEKGKHFYLVFSGTGTKQAIKTCDFPESACKGKTIELKSTFGFGEGESAENATALILFTKEVEFHF
jgi:hypothetical protein